MVSHFRTSVEAIEKLPALRRVILIERRHLQVFDVEGNAVTEGQHQNDGPDDGKRDGSRSSSTVSRRAYAHSRAMSNRRGGRIDSASAGVASGGGASTFLVRSMPAASAR